jgi:NAD(P)H-dependent FMN reductase
MQNKLHIPVVLGSAREGRESEKVAHYIVSVLSERDDVSTELVDVRDHVKDAITLPAWAEVGADSKHTAWKEIIEKSNALMLIVPEYNHGYPGELKLLLDSLGPHYKGLVVGLVGVSSGTLGGARVIEHIKPVLIELYMTPIKESIMIPHVKNAFDEDGNIKEESTTEYVNKIMDEIVVLAKKINE